MENWEICGYSVSEGEKKQVKVTPGIAGYELPVTLVAGCQEGKTILITAGNHSGEYPGISAAIRLANEIDPQQVSGKVMIMHCVNVSGFWQKSADLIPEDGFNLNKDYPGRVGGTTGECIASYFVEHIFPQVDFMIDLHSGGGMEPLTPCLFFPAAAGDQVRELSLAAAKVTNIPYLIASQAATGQYSYAAGLGIPGLLLERGHSNFCRPSWVQAYYEDLRLLLNHFAVYPLSEKIDICEKKIYEKAIYLTAAEDGLWYPAVTENSRVEKGDLLGRVEDFYGNLQNRYYAEESGVVFYYTSGLAVRQGDPLAAYGIE